jgi:receptor-type tyrosine-protein phosphatase R
LLLIAVVSLIYRLHANKSVSQQILLWLRKQMSREKDTEDGDRQGLVEDGAICQSDKLTKDAKGSVEAKWIHETAAKPLASTHATQPIPTASSLPEVNK